MSNQSQRIDNSLSFKALSTPPVAPVKGMIYFDGTNLKEYSGTAFVTLGGGSAQVATIKDEKSSGTQGGTFTGGAWQTRDLNTLSDPYSIVTSLSANQFVLPAGTYEIQASAPALFVDEHKVKLYNITAAADAIVGGSAFSGAGASGGITLSEVSGVITIGASSTFEIRHYATTTHSVNGFGTSTSAPSTVEVYTQVTITKLG